MKSSVSALAELAAAKRKATRTVGIDEANDVAVARLLHLEAAAGETFMGSSFSRKTAVDMHSARRMIIASTAITSERSAQREGKSPKKRCKFGIVGGLAGIKRAQKSSEIAARHVRKGDHSRQHRIKECSAGGLASAEYSPGQRQQAHDENSRRCLSTESDGAGVQTGSNVHHGNAGSSAVAFGPCGSSSSTTRVPTTLVDHHTVVLPTWVQKGMRVRLMATATGTVKQQTAVVLAARDATQVQLRHDQTQKRVTLSEVDLLPAAPEVGGHAMIFHGPHAQEVGFVVQRCDARRTVTMRLALGEMTISLLDVCEWPRSSF
uniref:Uncharacterized protein n=1 Tax=Chrysotila carterae TaxID=13221 RepID=A0A7S4AZG5_CHRCT